MEMKDDPANPITYEFAMQEKRQYDDVEEEARKASEKMRQEAENAEKMAALRQEMETEKSAQEAIRM